MSDPLTPHYSDRWSEDFWDAVNNRSLKADRDRLYALGVVLQNLEHHVLRQVNESVSLRQARGKKVRS